MSLCEPGRKYVQFIWSQHETTQQISHFVSLNLSSIFNVLEFFHPWDRRSLSAPTIVSCASYLVILFLGWKLHSSHWLPYTQRVWILMWRFNPRYLPPSPIKTWCISEIQIMTNNDTSHRHTHENTQRVIKQSPRDKTHVFLWLPFPYSLWHTGRHPGCLFPLNMILSLFSI